jgi:alanine racemase
MTSTRPTWAEVSRSRLLHNHDVLRRLAGRNTELLCVVKANAYGHGLADCARALEANGARWFGVTSVEEGVELRRGLPAARGDIRILVMSGVWEGEADAALEHNLTPVVWEAVHLDWLDAAARRLGKGAGEVPVHLELDSGMSRQGVHRSQIEPVLDRFTAESPLRMEALMTHFQTPELRERTHDQMNEVMMTVGRLLQRKMKPGFISAGSSANLLQGSDEVRVLTDVAVQLGGTRMVRAGISLYGYSPLRANPDAAMTGDPIPIPDPGLEPVLQWKTRVVALREIPAWATVGYDATFKARRPTRVALLPVGYADGLNRLLSNKEQVLVRGQRAPIAGRISMDQTTLDVTDVAGVEVGDEVALIGEQGEEKVTAADMAKATGTISYEVLCAIAARVPRTMVE